MRDSLGAAIAGTFGLPIVGELVYNDQNNVAAQRGVSDFDRTHRLVISGTWSIPGPDHSTSATIRKLGNDWSISGVATLQSGLPFSIMDSAAGTLFGPATIYTTGSLAPGATLADAGRSGSVSSRVNEFFNTSAFFPTPFVPDGGLIDGKYPVSGGGGTVFGNLGRNILRAGSTGFRHRCHQDHSSYRPRKVDLPVGDFQSAQQAEFCKSIQ